MTLPGHYLSLTALRGRKIGVVGDSGHIVNGGKSNSPMFLP
jgi:hypothetical protein